MVEEKLDEEADEDDAGGPDDPVRHLHRQAARIRRARGWSVLTALLQEGRRQGSFRNEMSEIRHLFKLRLHRLNVHWSRFRGWLGFKELAGAGGDAGG